MKVTDVETGGFCQPMLRLICLLLPKVIICDSQILIVIVALCVKTCCSFSTETAEATKEVSVSVGLHFLLLVVLNKENHCCSTVCDKLLIPHQRLPGIML